MHLLSKEHARTLATIESGMLQNGFGMTILFMKRKMKLVNSIFGEILQTSFLTMLHTSKCVVKNVFSTAILGVTLKHTHERTILQ